jgi:hypothetical protein
MRNAEYQQLAEAVVDEMEARGLVIPVAEAGKSELVEACDLAEEQQHARETIHRKITEWGLVRRGEDGYPKEGGGTTYVSRTAYEMQEPLPTDVVRRAAGLTD